MSVFFDGKPRDKHRTHTAIFELLDHVPDGWIEKYITSDGRMCNVEDVSWASLERLFVASV